MTEHSDKHLEEMVLVYLGDARYNMADSLMIGGTKLGMDIRLCAPKDLWPNEDARQGVSRVREGHRCAPHDHR